MVVVMLTTMAIAMANLMMVVMIVVSIAKIVRVTIPPLLLFITGSDDGTVRLWDVSTLREVAVPDDPSGKVRLVAFDVSGKYLATGEAIGVTCVAGVDDLRRLMFCMLVAAAY
jgi:WD40 repeat protein